MKKLLCLFVLLFASTVHAEVTFTFDDGWDSTLSEAFPILGQYGFVGTAYIITSYAGYKKGYLDWGDINVLAEHGWDVESHTATHPDLTKLSLAQAKHELDESIRNLKWHGYAAKHFAAPYGEVNPQVLALVKKRFVSSRGAWVKGNELNYESKLNSYDLSVLPLNETTDMWLVERCIEHATFEKRWLIFMVHKIVEDPAECKNDAYCVSRKKFKQVVDYTVNQGAKVVTIDEYFRNKGLEK